MKPLVSVLICTYNADKYIAKTLDSVINQTYNNMEILILDNSSSDNTVNIINDYVKKDSRIKLFTLWRNLWSYRWLNYLMDQSNWKYVAIQDHDDIWKNYKIEKQVVFLENNPCYIWSTTACIYWYEWDNKYFYYYWLWMNVNRWHHPSLVFRNDGYRYDEVREYMADCYFEKKILCNWKKLLYNFSDPMLIHRVRVWLWNYSFSWFKFNKLNLSTLFYCNGFFMWFLMFWFELFRKWFYPYMSLWSRYKFERLPFVLKWFKMKDYVWG